jgi:hypothetical protein
MEKEFNLDLSNSKGWGKKDFDPDLPSEHGEILTDEDLELLSTTYGDFCPYPITGTKRKHRALVKMNPNNSKTAIFLHGGAGRIFAVDTKIYPRGMILPMNLFARWPDDINLVVIDFDHGLGWAWTRVTENLKFKNLPWDKLSYVADKAPDTQQGRLLSAYRDFFMILEQIKNLMGENNQLWTIGHCNACEFLARFYDTIEDHTKISGMILASPSWRSTWRYCLDKLQYFQKEVEIPLMTVQHIRDRALVTDELIAVTILERSGAKVTKYLPIDGGIDPGLPHFSMGHHGFRGVEDELISGITDFIRAN